MTKWNDFKISGYLTRPKALSIYNDGICEAARSRKPWEETHVTVGGLDYDCYTRSIYGKGFAVQIACGGKVVSEYMYVLGHYPGPEELHDVWSEDLLNAIVFSNFSLAYAVIKQMYSDRFLAVNNMTGKGKYLEVRKCRGRNGRVIRYTADECKGACMATDFYGLVPLNGVIESGEHGVVTFDELYQAWMNDNEDTF